jgi:DNA replication protein DnaC
VHASTVEGWRQDALGGVAQALRRGSGKTTAELELERKTRDLEKVVTTLSIQKCLLEKSACSRTRRPRDSRIGAFKPIADFFFDWKWPDRIDRQAIEDLFHLRFIDEGVNPIPVGPNGVGKTMLLCNLAHHALVDGHTVRLSSASEMLADLAAQVSSAALAPRLSNWNHMVFGMCGMSACLGPPSAAGSPGTFPTLPITVTLASFSMVGHAYSRRDHRRRP